ncbi:MAG: N-methyl-L-tryptophan oxidase [Rhizomicrobium sp.]
MTRYDAVIVGLGAMGSAALYQFARRGARVLGIDRYIPPHDRGSSHGDTRITRLAIGEGAHYTPMVMRSHEIWRAIEGATGCDLLTQCGGLVISSAAKQSFTHVPRFFENTLATARAHGVAHELLDTGALRDRFAQFAVRDGETGYYEPGAGFLRPEACIRAQLDLALRHGAEIRTGEIATAFDGTTVTTDRGSYRAETTILAAGAWLPGLLDARIAGPFKVHRQTLHWFDPGQARDDFHPQRFPVFIWELQRTRQGIYGFPAIDGGGVKIATEQYADATTPDAVARDVSPGESRAMHEAFVAPQFPALSGRCLKSAVCLYTVTPDFQFVIDRHPEIANVIVASPCSGHGFKHSPAIGEALAQQVLDGRSDLDLSPFRFARFQ